MKKTVLASSVLLSISGHSVSIFAAEQASSDKDLFQLEEVVVTAQRISQSIQDVPLSVTAVSAEDIERRKINDPSQLTFVAPTLQVGQDTTFSLRGVGTQIFDSTVDSSVAMAVDDVNLGRRFLGGQPFNDVERIEVLNGPQGLLFGKNASSGLLNITTRRPVIGEFGGEADLQYITLDTTPSDAKYKQVKGTLNLPLTDSSALRINVLSSDNESIAKNVNPDTETTEQASKREGVKVKYLFENGPLSIYAIADYNDETGQPANFIRTYRHLGEGSAMTDTLAADGIEASENNMYFSGDGLTRRDLEVGGVQGTVSYELDNSMELINIAAWRFYELHQDLDGDHSSMNGMTANHNDSDYDQFSNELRLVIPGNDFVNGQVGLFYFRSELDTDQYLSVESGIPSFVLSGFPFCVGAPVTAGPPPACNVSNDTFLGSDTVSNMKTDSVAAFGQFDFHITDKLSLLAGGRLTRDELSIDFTQAQRNYFISIQGEPGDYSADVGVTNFSWKVGGQYQLTEDSMVYANLGKGYKAPGFNAGATDEDTPLVVKEETSTNFEAGYKSTLLDNRLVFNVSVFNTEFDNYQSQSFDAELQSFIIQNAASITSRGAEVTVTALAMKDLTLNWNASFLDSKFNEFEGAQCYPGQPTTECIDGSQDASGLPTPLAADFTSSFVATYEFSLSDDVEAFVQGSWYHRSDMNYKIGGDLTRIDAVDTFGVTAGVDFANGLSVSLFCRNCTDERVPTNIGYEAGDNNDGIATTVQTWGPESVRNIGVSLGYEF